MLSCFFEIRGQIEALEIYEESVTNNIAASRNVKSIEGLLKYLLMLNSVTERLQSDSTSSS